MNKNMLITIAAVVAIVLALTVLFGGLIDRESTQQTTVEDLKRYEISRDDFETWLIDDVTRFYIEKRLQAIEIDEDYLYSYGQSGFAMINRKTNKICYVFDENTLSYRKHVISLEQQHTPNYITIKSLSEISPSEKQMYELVKSENNEKNYRMSSTFKSPYDDINITVILKAILLGTIQIIVDKVTGISLFFGTGG